LAEVGTKINIDTTACGDENCADEDYKPYQAKIENLPLGVLPSLGITGPEVPPSAYEP
jgi:hypothetical protein